MGFREGEGLGKFGQGRREIVEASTQRGRRGLGLKLQGFQGELNVDWRDEPEVNTFCCFYSVNSELFTHTVWIHYDVDMTYCFLPCFLLFLFVQPSAIEKVDWFPECTTEIPDSDELREWMTLGQVSIQNTVHSGIPLCLIHMHFFKLLFFTADRENLRLRMRQGFAPKTCCTLF